MNSPTTLRKQAADLAALSSLIPPEAVETRFLRNSFLINPKSLCILPCDEPNALDRYHVFAVYKPPFCPMRRSQAHENHHKVSVESFVQATLSAEAILPTIRRTLAPSDVKVRVLNDLQSFASGPVLVSLADRHPFARSLRRFTMEYDVLVAGHLPLAGLQEIQPWHLFPNFAKPTGEEELSSSGGHATAECTCSYQVRQNAYYSVHPVSLLSVSITSPPTSHPPEIDAFVREHLETGVIGDPYTIGDFVQRVTGRSSKREVKDPKELPSKYMKRAADDTSLVGSSVVAMRGDCDFPRVFTHLSAVTFGVAVLDATGAVLEEKRIGFHCRKCFNNILHKNPISAMRSSHRIGILDGSWNLSTEYL